MSAARALSRPGMLPDRLRFLPVLGDRLRIIGRFCQMDRGGDVALGKSVLALAPVCSRPQVEQMRFVGVTLDGDSRQCLIKVASGFIYPAHIQFVLRQQAVYKRDLIGVR